MHGPIVLSMADAIRTLNFTEQQMKKSLTLIAAMLVALSAQAANDTYKFSATETMSTYNVYKVEPFDGGKQVKVYYVNGGDNYYIDKTGTLLNRILENQPEFVQVTGTQSHVNPQYAVRVVCNAGKSQVFIQNSAITATANDNCAMAQEINTNAK